MENHPVQQRVAAIRRRLTRLAAVYGWSATIAIAVAAAVLLGLADYVWRFRDPGVRTLASLAFAGLIAVSVYRFLLPALRFRPSLRQVAQRIEMFYPKLANRLSSAIEFLHQAENDPAAGSFELRRAVIAQTSSEIERLDFRGCLDPRRPKRAVLLAGGACVLAGLIVACDVGAAGLAARRLIAPWSNQPWPRRHVLEFVETPTRLAAGSEFEVAVVDRAGSLPERVEIQYWFDGEPPEAVQTKEMKFLGERMVHRLENVTRSFQYRAVGGDDVSMPWTQLQVVEPPRVEQHEITLHPPAYTNWPATACDKNILALAGTRVAIRGRMNKPVASVVIRTDPADETAGVLVSLSPDGLEFSLSADIERPWALGTATSYWIETTDLEGLVGGGTQRWNIRLLRDSPPVVSLEKPSGTTFVTADAVVQLEGAAKDDIAIRSVDLRFLRSDRSGDGEATMELFRGPELPPVQTEKAAAASPAELAGDSYPVNFSWDLATLTGLMPGTQIDFHIAASDYQPQVGQSTPRRLTIISAAELEDRIAGRQTFILGQLAEVLRVQQAARTQTRSLEIQLDETKKLSKNDLDQLQSAELNQRQVTRLLTDSQDGVAVQIDRLLEELASNRVAGQEVVQRMTELKTAVTGIARQQLPEIDRALVDALKRTRAMAAAAPTENEITPEPPVRESLRQGGEQQDAVIATLERLLGDLSEWDSYRRFSREIGRLKQDQENVRQETDRLRLETLGQDAANLDEQQAANLKRLGEQQAELARRFDKTKTRMEKMRTDLEQSDPAAAATLADALDAAQRAAISGQMREAGRNIEENRIGQAAAAQQQATESLQEVLDTLAHRREHELQRQLEKLTEAAADLKELRRHQQDLQRQTEGATKLPDEAERKRQLERLSREQKELAEQTERLARRLERLQAERASQAAAQAGEAQQAAGQAAESGDGQQSLEHLRQAEKLLEEAEQQVAAARRQAQQDLDREQMVRLQQQIQGIVGRQQSVYEATIGMETLRLEQGEITREQLATVGNLAEQQRQIAADSGGLAEQLADSEAFSLSLRGATREMLRAAKSLDRHEAGEPAQQAQRIALLRLKQLYEALRQDSPAGNPPDQQNPPQEQPPQNAPLGDAIQTLAELKLLKSMQEEINRRTKELESSRGSGGSLTDEQVSELNDLTAEQGTLAELLLNLIEKASQ